MLSVIIIILDIFCVLLIRVIRGLSSELTIELKRKARNGDINSAKLYKLKSTFGSEPQLLSSVLLLVFLSINAVIVSTNYSKVGAALLITINNIIIVTFGFFGEQSPRLASMSALVFEKLLRILNPILKHPAKFIDKFIKWTPNKAFNSKAELISLISVESAKSELSIQEKRAIHGALTFGERKIKEIMIPNTVVKQVAEMDVLSPVVISELHDSGYSRFPVYGDAKNVVGTLYMKDAVNVRSNKQIKDVMRPEVFYLNEEQSLRDALKAFLKTKHHLFMVTNSYEDIVGILTIEDVLEQIIGEKIIDEFDQYDDLKVMAERLAQKKREERA